MLGSFVWLGISKPAMAQVINGDFETQNHVPQTTGNIAGPHSKYDDLANWTCLIGDFSADYWATNSPTMNPLAINCPPRSGIGCVKFLREPGSFYYDSFISQPVTLVPGHTYRANFYARHTHGSLAEALMLAVSDQEPTDIDFDRFSTTSTYRNLLPTPYATIISAPVHNDTYWALVSGTFTVPFPVNATSPTVTNYITIGYAEAQGQYDPALDHHISVASNNAIDDVSLVDITSACDIVRTTILDPYGPRNFCSNQNQRPFGVRNATTGLTFEWQFYDITYPNGVRTVSSRPHKPFNGTSTSANPQLMVNGIDFPPGDHLARVRGRAWINGTWCYTQWRELDWIVGDDCTYSYPNDNMPRIAATISVLTIMNAQENEEIINTAVAYPNPVSEILIIPRNSDMVTLLNSEGKAMVTSIINGQLNVKQLLDGLYDLRMRQNGKWISQHIQVKH